MKDQDGQVQHGPEIRYGEQTAGAAAGDQHQGEHGNPDDQMKDELEQQIEDETARVTLQQPEEFLPNTGRSGLLVRYSSDSVKIQVCLMLLSQ